MERPSILLTRRWPTAVEQFLSQHFDVRVNEADRPLPAEALAAALEEVDALCPTVSDRLDARVLGTPRLRSRLIASYGVGVDHINLAAARARGVVVTNTPDVLTECTADLTLALLLAVARRIAEGDAHVRSGAWQGWRPTHMLGTRVAGKTLGLIGFGRIARAVARRACAGFGMRVLYHRPRGAVSAGSARLARYCPTITRLLEASDFVSVHCPSTPDTRHLLNAARLRCMKPSAFLINTARGDVVDTTALIEALRAGTIAGAALDVYEGEPGVPEALRGLPNVVLLPHLGSATRETRVAMGLRVARNLEAFFRGEPPPDRVV